jgi:hypothetical protein
VKSEDELMKRPMVTTQLLAADICRVEEMKNRDMQLVMTPS